MSADPTPISLSILGSCVSRDPFAFAPDDRFAIDAYVARTSLISLMADPVPVAPDAFDFDPPFEKRSILADFNKTGLAELLKPSDWLLVDFVDERFDIAEVGGSFVLCTPHVLQCGVLDATGPYKIIKRTDPALIPLWNEACDRFCARLRQASRGDKIVLHQGKYVERYVDNDSLKDFQPWKLEFARAQTALIDGYHRRIREIMPGVKIIDVSEQHRLADAHHPWGLQPFHYVKGYYADFMRQLRDLTSAAPREDRRDR